MTREELIKSIYHGMNCQNPNCPTELSCKECIENQLEEYENQIKAKALKKQLPKKPIIRTNLMTKHVSAHCSVCDTDITYYSSEEKYCHNCGQTIKWE